MASVPRIRSMSPARNADLQIRYRTMSLRLEEGDQVTQSVGKAKPDPASALKSLDVHLYSPNDICTRFSTHPERGLDPQTVARKAVDGKNKITPPPTRYWMKALNYVFGGFNFLMWIAFIVTILSYKPLGGDNPAVFNLGVAMLILAVIIVSATFYAVVDWNASRIMKSIKGLVADDAIVIRDLKRERILAEDVVVGDLVELSIGQRCPADLRLVKVSPDCKFDRSLLTGESDPVPATIDPSSDNPLETKNLALMSTFLVSGSCTGIVFQIGDNSVMGRLVLMAADTKFKMTTIQRELWFFTKIVSFIALSLFCLSIIVWAAWLRVDHPGYATASGAIINSIGCLTAFVPQGLPVCVALSLTIVAKRMAKRHVLVKNLATLETLGCMSVLCSDKTGTLTEGRMAVQDVGFADRDISVASIDPDEEEEEEKKGHTEPTVGLGDVQFVSRLCNGAKFNDSHSIGDAQIIGDATDSAILRFAESLPHAQELVDGHSIIFEIPFNSKNKWMLSVVHPTGNSSDCTLLIKGAPDRLFNSCKTALTANGDVVPFDYSHFRAVQDRWAEQGLRVLALCRRSLSGSKIDFTSTSNLEEQVLKYGFSDLTLVGLIGLRDPPRPDVKRAVQVIRDAHVKVFMVTGDYLATAIGIAKKISIITNEHVDGFADVQNIVKTGSEHSVVEGKQTDSGVWSLALQGADVEKLSPMDWDVIIDRYTEIVFARTTPEQKLRIVEEIKCRNDNTVAVTGDGVNDAPALQAADIGVAMGAGSDVAKNAAAMILLNNDFASIPVAIENGRLVFDNLKKVVLYVLPVGTYTEFMAVFANVFLGMQIPLSSYLQVFFSIANDVVMSISLMFEKPESDLMTRFPRNARKDRLTDWRFFLYVYCFIGLMAWPCCMGMWFLWFQRNGLGFYDLVFAYEKWADGYKGRTLDDLTVLVNTGQSIYYVTMVFIQYGGLLAVRNRRVSIVQSNPLWGPRRNLAVPLGMIATMALAVMNVYGPGIQHVFGTHTIPGMFWGLPFAFASGVLMMDEIRKLIVRSYPKSWIAKAAW